MMRSSAGGPRRNQSALSPDSQSPKEVSMSTRHRLRMTPVIKSLFHDVPIESGMTDAEIVKRIDARVAHKSFSRHRVSPPNWLRFDELRLLARLATLQVGGDPAQVIAMIRDPESRPGHPL